MVEIEKPALVDVSADPKNRKEGPKPA